MELDTLHALYIERLRDLYSAESQIIKALPKMYTGASNDELRQAFKMHLEQTEQQVERLERIFEDLGVSPKGKHCKGMEGLLAEADELLGEDADDDVMDAGLIASAQAVEHYEMAGYGTARAYSELLGLDEHTELLQQTLSEEDESDRLLSEIAMTSVNLEAMGEDTHNGDAREPSSATSASSSGKQASRGARKSSGRPRSKRN